MQSPRCQTGNDHQLSQMLNFTYMESIGYEERESGGSNKYGDQSKHVHPDHTLSSPVYGNA